MNYVAALPNYNSLTLMPKYNHLAMLTVVSVVKCYTSFEMGIPFHIFRAYIGKSRQ